MYDRNGVTQSTVEAAKKKLPEPRQMERERDEGHAGCSRLSRSSRGFEEGRMFQPREQHERSYKDAGISWREVVTWTVSHISSPPNLLRLPNPAAERPGKRGIALDLWPSLYHPYATSRLCSFPPGSPPRLHGHPQPKPPAARTWTMAAASSGGPCLHLGSFQILFHQEVKPKMTCHSRAGNPAEQSLPEFREFLSLGGSAQIWAPFPPASGAAGDLLSGGGEDCTWAPRGSSFP